MMRACFSLLISVWLIAPVTAQTQEEGEMRLYIQQLEERIRQLTGENERLFYELNQMRASLGQPPLQAGPQQTGAVNGVAPNVDNTGVQVGPNLPPGAPPQELGSISVSPNDPLIAPDGVDESAPVDLSTLAGGVAGELVGSDPATAAVPSTGVAPDLQTAGLPAAPSPTTALSGSPRDEYDLAYGYILTGDYDLAEETFKTWLASFPTDPQSPDAQFWLGESHLQQGEYRDAANAFLGVYQTAPDSTKGPDALMKLGVSLSALGEKTAACATLAELGKRYPQASEALTSRVRDEEARAGC
jgi:tol-pal system protein YbgF